jgi:type VI secretion system secreted protein VgrG
VDVDASDALDLERGTLLEPATLTLHVAGGEPRQVRGIVAAVEAQGAFQQGRHAFRLRLVPRLWLLGKRKTSRIFQDMSVPAIVGDVLGQAGVRHRSALVERHAPRTYCVQYQETDLAFVTRILSEEGIFYFFEHEGEDRVVLGDSAHLYPPIAGAPALAYRYEQQGSGLRPEEHHVRHFARRRTVRSGAVLQRDYDFRRPLLDLRAEARPSASAAPPAGVAGPQTLSVEAEQLRVYDHHGEDERPDVDPRTARVRLEQLRRRAVVAEGASACRRLVPGFRFDLADHPVEALDGGYVVEGVEHEGSAPEVALSGKRVYTNTFTCVPADVPLRPRRSRRVLQQVAETALVVGPEGKDIYTDALGRVKVQFPWDLQGKRDERSSCWIRVSQAWAGTGWGAQFVPRVGMEVLVLFVGGDVDRPIVAGCLPNARTVPPFDPSRCVSRSGWRTRSLGGNGAAGSNELSFDDAKGREEILARSEGDVRVIARRRYSLDCAEQNVVVQGRRTENLGASETVVAGGWSLAAETVSRQVAGDVSDLVTGKASLAAGAGDVRISGDQRQEVAGEVTAVVGGCFTTLVGRATARASWTTHATGSAVLSAEGAIELCSEKEIVLRVGDTSLRIGPNGVEILGGTLRASDGAGGLLALGPKGIRMETPGGVRVQAARVVARSANASMDLDRDVALDGEMIRLNSPTPPDDGPPVQPPVLTLVQLVDQDGAPVAAARFIVTVGQERRSGVLDAKGEAELEDGEKIVFPDHDVEGAPVTALGPRTHVVKSGEHLAQIAAQLGLDAAAVWGHAKNADLRTLRADPHILAEGDVIWFDAVERGALPLRPGANPFRAHIRRMETLLRLVGPSAKPLAGEPFEAEVDGLPLQRGATDGEGELKVIHPCAARACTVRLTRLGKVLRLGLGQVDPVDTVSGLTQRLAALGHYKGNPSTQLDEATSAALQAFQKAHGLGVTGKITTETTEAIVAAYGS